MLCGIFGSILLCYQMPLLSAKEIFAKNSSRSFNFAYEILLSYSSTLVCDLIIEH